MMDELNIKAILKAGESQTVEFKTSFGRETIESLDALSVEKIEKFIAQVNECGRFSLDQSPLLALEKIKYVVNGRPNWAAMLLFAEEPVRHHIHIEESGSGLLVTFEIKADVTPPSYPPHHRT